MNTISDAIQKQAAAVKDNSTQLLLANQLEKMAAQIRTDAGKPIHFKFSDTIRTSKDKGKRLEKFSAAMKKDRISEAERLLAAAGWRKLTLKNSNQICYGKKKQPGLLLTLEGGIAFNVMYHEKEEQPKTPLAFLQTYLDEQSKSKK